MLERFRISEKDKGEQDIQGHLLNPRERDELIEETKLHLITPEEREKLLREVNAEFFKSKVYRLHFADGLSQQEIAAKMGISVHTIYRCFKREGWTPRISTKKIILDHGEVSRLYYGEGLTQQEVAYRLGVSKSTVYRHFSKHSMKPHRIATRDEVDSNEVHRLHFEEILSRNEIAEKLDVSERTISRIFRDEGWVVNRNKRSRVDIDEIHDLYFNEKMTQREVAQEIGVPVRTISNVFKEQEWEARRIKVDVDEIYQLYFIEELTQREVAEELNIREGTISHHFRKQSWKARGFNPKAKQPEVDVNEVYNLYFKDQFSRSEVAKLLNISPSVVSRIFKENEWNFRNYRLYSTEEERELARISNRKKTTRRITELRETLFGKACRICGEERRLVIHKKDGEKHGQCDLWRLHILQSVNPDEWAALCIPCHLGVHWMMNKYEANWNQLESQSLNLRKSLPTSREPLDLPKDDTPSSKRYIKLKDPFEGNRRELRMVLFGEKCHFCSVHYEEKRVAIHRKDGRPHEERLTVYEKYFRTLNSDEWVPLCQNHHRFVHWAMDDLGLEWVDLKKFKIREDGAEGEMYSDSGKSQDA